MITIMVFTYNKDTNGNFTCPDCKFTAQNQSTMHYHLKNHEGNLSHECKHCDMKFLQKSVLTLHIKSKHSDVTKKDTFKCPCCTYSDLRKGNCVIHFTRIHLKDLTDSLKKKSEQTNAVTDCKGCNKSFKSMTMFYYHVSNCIKISENHPMNSEWKKLVA
jgi:hypothetical protein